ncbi:hypothetical protein [Streptomyces sp. NPDC089919]|uniref:hypothetical protein n=1 Tax=Streptomyces sp. NPDC089919 TaxID=3155188 RepID=UPI003412D845
MFARRPLLTAIGAGTLLTALWFVPSANATQEHAAAPTHQNVHSVSVRSGTSAALPADQPAQLALADTGGVDTSPYLLGGALFLSVGAGCVAFSTRRSRAR